MANCTGVSRLAGGGEDSECVHGESADDYVAGYRVCGGDGVGDVAGYCVAGAGDCVGFGVGVGVGDGVSGVGDVGLTCVSLELAPGPRQQQGARIPHISSTSASINLTSLAPHS